jgi:hypothetical protein
VHLVSAVEQIQEHVGADLVQAARAARANRLIRRMAAWVSAAGNCIP